ncbi:MAG TPA: hypothetical protein VND44_06205 [Acidimicrobiales bacterium]|nr:hypothetical protein [Acidimicrobiales bacterium]
MGDLRRIKKRAGALLDGLGRDPDEVAASLRDVGVQGVPRSNSSCAVALYASALLETDPRIRSVAVGPCTLVLTLTRQDGARPGGRLVVQLPKAVRGFVAGFDARAYPEVIRGALPTAPSTPATGPGSRPDPGPSGTPEPPSAWPAVPVCGA